MTTSPATLHLTDAQAQQLADGLAEPALAGALEAHAAGCPGCGALLESYRILGEALGDLSVPELPADFTASVLDRIEVAELAQARERRLAFTVLEIGRAHV